MLTLEAKYLDLRQLVKFRWQTCAYMCKFYVHLCVLTVLLAGFGALMMWWLHESWNDSADSRVFWAKVMSLVRIAISALIVQGHFHFSKGHFHWKILKSIGHLTRGTKTRALPWQNSLTWEKNDILRKASKGITCFATKTVWKSRRGWRGHGIVKSVHSMPL